MPYITITLMEGRSEKVKEQLVKNITDVAASDLDVNKENIRVELNELKEGHFAIGGQMAKRQNK